MPVYDFLGVPTDLSSISFVITFALRSLGGWLDGWIEGCFRDIFI